MTTLPTGTVTFLFTEIEDSTRLWENAPGQMRRVLERHDEIVRGAIEGAGGAVVKTVSGAFHGVFGSAAAAVGAVVRAQQGLQQEGWPDETPVQVRMGLHTGSGDERDGDYFGPAVNRAARLMAVAYGGQSLVSGLTRELVDNRLPEGVVLRDLGRHRLKDLTQPEQVYQIVHPDLPGDFPLLRTLDQMPGNLPPQLTSFIGREPEMAQVRAQLATTRLLTLLGPGGSGKTRLALQVAVGVVDDYPDGVWLVELAPVAEAERVAQTVASALGIKEQPGQPLTQTLIAALRDKRLLLLLDNCEHVILACARFAGALLPACPGVRVLATSREPLGIAGERPYRVPPLSLPDQKDNRKATAESLSRYEAVRLLTERAQRVRAAFVVTDRNAATVAQICQRLDGIPLAIELAAARMGALPVEDINDRLDQRFRLLTGGDSASMPRQQTLRALVDWSYDLLSASEQLLLARVSVFAGGCTLEAVEAICGFDPLDEWEVLDLLTGLIDKSLVVAEDEGSITRYRLLETLRQYGAEKLDQSGEAALVRARHGQWYLTLAETLEPTLTGPEQKASLDRLEREHDNLRAAREHGLDERDAPRLAGALYRFWYVRGYLSEGRASLTHALAQVRTLDPVPVGVLAKVLYASGGLALEQGEYARARAFQEESLVLRRQIDDRHGTGQVLNSLGLIANGESDYEAAQQLFEEALEIRRALGDTLGTASTLNNLGNVATTLGDHAAARAWYEQSLRLHRERGDRQSIAILLGNLGSLSHVQGDLSLARTLQEECLALSRELGDKQGTAGALGHLGNIAHARRDYASAQALQEEALALLREIEDPFGTAVALVNLGSVALFRDEFVTAQALFGESLVLFQTLGNKHAVTYGLAGLAAARLGRGDASRAVVLWGAATALRTALGTPLSPPEAADQADRLTHARTALGPDAYPVAWEEGQRLTWDTAVAYALATAS